MKITTKNRQLWQELYKTAETFKKLKPWEWMYDSDIFGVQDPETGEFGFCCVMGNAKQVYALAVYMGVDGLASYWDIAEGEEGDPISAGLNQKCLMVSFEDRDMLSEADRKQIKALGLKYRGKRQWIQFRDYQPGYYPWYITEKQAQFLIHAMNQTMGVALRFEENEKLLHKDDETYFVRRSKKINDGLEWSDDYLVEDDLEEILIEQENLVVPNAAAVSQLKKELKQSKGAILYSLTYMRQTIQENKNERPYFALLSLWISYPSYFIVGQQLFSPETLNSFEDYFFNTLRQVGHLPGQLVVPNDMTYRKVEPYAKALGMELIYAPEEQGFKEVYNSLSQFF